MEAAASKSVQRRETLELSFKIAPLAALGSPVAFAGSSSAAASQPWAVALGAPLRARYLASSRGSFGTKWYSGVATAVHADGSVDVAYDDGDAEVRVQPKFIKAPAAQPPVAQAPVAPPAANPAVDAAAVPGAEGRQLRRLRRARDRRSIHAGAGRRSCFQGCTEPGTRDYSAE